MNFMRMSADENLHEVMLPTCIDGPTQHYQMLNMRPEDEHWVILQFNLGTTML
jgi:hypothetical protein